MNVVRLVVLGILFYVAWLLLRGLFDFRKKGTVLDQKQSAGKDSKVEDVLVEDPVCHTLVPRNQAIRLRKDGETYYFCSNACCDKFSDTVRKEE